MQRLAQAQAKGQQYRSLGVVGVLDLDHFKVVNDRFCHDVGGEEFRMLLHNTPVG